MIQKILSLFKKPKPEFKGKGMISEVAIDIFRKQQYSLTCAKRMSDNWATATANERKQLLDAYIESRRALPRLDNGKHLGHWEAYMATCEPGTYSKR